MGITPVADVNQYDTRNISVPFYLVEMVMSKKGNGESEREKEETCSSSCRVAGFSVID